MGFRGSGKKNHLILVNPSNRERQGTERMRYSEEVQIEGIETLEAYHRIEMEIVSTSPNLGEW